MDDAWQAGRQGTGAIERSAVPAYHQIARILRLRVASGLYPVQSQLPTDDELMREFSVSRHTARAAVQQLVTEGVVRRFPGRGTFVLAKPGRADQWAAQSLEDMLEHDFTGALKVDRIERIPGAAAYEAGSVLQAEPDEQIMRVCWSRSGSEGVESYASVYLPAAYADQLPDDLAERLQTSRLLHLVERYCGVEPYRVRQSTRALAANAQTARLLGVARGAPLLQLSRAYFDREGRAIEYSQILCRQTVNQTVELYRKQINA